jgi:hypothetical protein
MGINGNMLKAVKSIYANVSGYVKLAMTTD